MKNNVVPTALHKKIETALDSLLNTSKAEDKSTVAKDEEEIAYLLPHEMKR